MEPQRPLPGIREDENRRSRTGRKIATTLHALAKIFFIWSIGWASHRCFFGDQNKVDKNNIKWTPSDFGEHDENGYPIRVDRGWIYFIPDKQLKEVKP